MYENAANHFGENERLLMSAFRNSEGGGGPTPYVITVITQPKISGPAVITQPKRHPEPGARP